MIDHKTFLVARRELVENVRTKTFWIGIFMLPLIYGIAIGVNILLKDAKQVRAYAVLDLSGDGRLDAAIQQRAATTDLLKVSGDEADGSTEADGGTEAAQRAERARQWFESLPQEHPLRDLVARLAAAGVSFDAASLRDGEGLNALPPDARKVLMGWFRDVAGDPEKVQALRSLASDISLGRYRRVSLQELGIDPDAQDVERQLNAKIQDETLFAYFVLPEDPVDSDQGARYVSNNLTDNDLRQWYEQRATEVVRDLRVRKLGLSEDDARSILKSFDFRKTKVSATGEAEDVEVGDQAASFAPVAFVYLLWIAVFTAAQMLLTNTVEEKSNRLIEVLLSSVSPLQLMTGKVLGIAATGLTIVLSWVLSSIVGVQFVPDDSPLGGGTLTAIIGDPLYLGSFVFYFLAGYLLYGAILVALGSVCSSLKEAQNLMQPIFILLIIPLVAMIFVVQEPNGTVARILTYVPFFTPFLMMNRAGGPPPTWEYVASTLLILVSLWVAFRAAAKVFRIGILMTGKPPKPAEILRWLRAPIGTITPKRIDVAH
ncbi:MAG: ABC transporter permease [Planctomycetes bacterium]|nr:ABC transporter permease [Planctomycetota bacterium]